MRSGKDRMKKKLSRQTILLSRPIPRRRKTRNNLRVTPIDTGPRSGPSTVEVSQRNL
jgi:hypothetical protein